MRASGSSLLYSDSLMAALSPKRAFLKVESMSWPAAFSGANRYSRSPKPISRLS
jgi:hypothetical protein